MTTTIISPPEVAQLHRFYEVKYSIRHPHHQRIEIDPLKVARLLMKLGYYQYCPEQGVEQYIHIQDKRITLITQSDIIVAMNDYIDSLPPLNGRYTADDETTIDYTITAENLAGELLKQHGSIFSSALFIRMRYKGQLNIITDNRNTTYFYFLDTAITITPQGIRTTPYTDLDGYIWESSIIPLKYIDIPGEKSDFEQFCLNICNQDPTRLQSLMSILGYLMNYNFDHDELAIIFTDLNQDNSDTNRNAGGTGKGLLGKALAHMLNAGRNTSRYIAIPGKSLDMSKDTKYSLADITTQIIHLEDIKTNFDFRQLYNDIADGGAHIRQLYQKAFIRPVKFMLSTNLTINLSDESSRRRTILFELSNHYNSTHRPEHDFHRRFWGPEWTPIDWLLFYNFMLRCSLTFHQHDIIPPEELNYTIRRLHETTNTAFLTWFSTYIPQRETNERTLIKRQYYTQFTTRYPEYATGRYSITQNTFTAWCKRYLDAYHIPYIEARSTDDILIINPTPETRNRYTRGQ